MLKKIFNADDFGISPGVNQAITKAHKEGVLNSTSIMINLKYAPQAVELAGQMPDLNIGLHANLTHGFVDLALLSVLHPRELKRQVKIEVKAQIEKALAAGIKLTHLDSHRHVHMIPGIFKAFLELQQEYKIPRLRFVNENPWLTIKSTKGYEWLKDGGLVKNLVLVSCAMLNKLLWKYKSDTYFYSIINTCKISRDKLKDIKIPAGYQAVEVGIHPGMPSVDSEYLADVFDRSILKDWRQKELETLLDKTVEQEFS